ncbi:HDOD domain-containing protein [Vibrio hannami]|uniref:HDOD domain-containing protein n=1 Tax=Vibrio hannami TaxID=2717094 RepID=UPI00240FFAAA|nr:HDOD domain-containing protein [Vibrio hannami]MDG3087985.1 HDOD domain-containing protein [Vibrio hannami]
MFKRIIGKFFPGAQQYKVSSARTQKAVPAANMNSSARDDLPIAPHDADFLNYLFGDSELKTHTDPFSDFVSERVEQLLLTPKALLQELPVMPDSVTTLVAELQGDDFNVDALLEVIEREPSMAAEVIKLANSARYRRSERQVTDLKTAFMNMGAQGLIEGVIDAYVKKFTPKNNIYWRQFGDKIWQHSIDTGLYAKALIKSSHAAADQATAYFVGLIRNLGKMIIFQVMVEAFHHVDPNVPPNSMAFKKLINSYEIRLTYMIAKYWQLPDTVLKAIAYQASSRYECTPLALAVLEANYLSELKCLLSSEIIDADEFERRCENNLTTNSALTMADYIKAEILLELS